MKQTIDAKRTGVYDPVVLFTALVAVFGLAVHISMAFCHDFWMDDIYTLGFIDKSKSIKDLLHICLTREVTNPPLYYLFVYGLYRCLPHVEGILLLPSVFAFAAGEVFCALYVWNVSGRKKLPVALLLCMLPFNCFTISYTVTALRAYSFLFLFVSAFLFFHERCRTRGGMGYILVTGIVLTLMGFTHYAGVIMAPVIGLADLVAVLRKKQPWKLLLMYVLPVFLVGAWALAALQTRGERIAFWQEPPTFSRLVQITSWLFGSKYVFLLTALGGTFLFIQSCFKQKVAENRVLWILLVNVIYMVLGLYIYSVYIKPEGGLFVFRYFVAVLPQAMIAVVLIINTYAEKILKNGGAAAAVCVLAIMSFLIFIPNIVSIKGNLAAVKPNRLTASLLQEVYEDKDGSVVVVHGVESYLEDGYTDFYLDGAGEYRLMEGDDVEQLKEMDRIYMVHVEGYSQYGEGLRQVLEGFHIQKSYNESRLVVYDRN